MPDTKISALSAVGTLDGTEKVPMVQGGVTKQATALVLMQQAALRSFPEGGGAARMGVATLVTGVKTVNTTAVGANSRILLTAQSLGTVVAPKALAVTARVNGTSFTITSADATDTSVVAWQIWEPGA